jgi:hypothetical protein
MPTRPTPKKTLKQEKLWYIDAKKGSIYYDCSNDVHDGWWKRLDFTKHKANSETK